MTVYVGFKSASPSPPSDPPHTPKVPGWSTNPVLDEPRRGDWQPSHRSREVARSRAATISEQFQQCRPHLIFVTRRATLQKRVYLLRIWGQSAFPSMRPTAIWSPRLRTESCNYESAPKHRNVAGSGPECVNEVRMSESGIRGRPIAVKNRMHLRGGGPAATCRLNVTGDRHVAGGCANPMRSVTGCRCTPRLLRMSACVLGHAFSRPGLQRRSL